jgi:hypothetical protein
MTDEPNAGGGVMVLKFLFWTSMLLMFVGTKSSEGALFYFFAVLLLMGAIGRFLRRRAKQVSVTSAPASGAAGKPAQKAKSR